MKEPITERDLLIISTICTGFGILLSWGLFYRWGSAPPSKPVDLSAWVQAIGSIVGILLAIAIPYLQRRSEVRDRKERDALIARSLGTVLLRELIKFEGKIKRDQRIASGAGSTEIVDIETNTIPREIWDRVERLHELGPAGHHALLAINAVQHAQEELDGGRLTPTDGRSDRFRGQIGIARVECETAIKELRRTLT
ncbi:hypothetical protein ABE493_14805 [Stenotrophomonas terrae]|uniref:hypothetical protein n=1 Tax=Stenotrophomonas terrae TaxID=405446 RepID=UPI00320AF077